MGFGDFPDIFDFNLYLFFYLLLIFNFCFIFFCYQCFLLFFNEFDYYFLNSPNNLYTHHFFQCLMKILAFVDIHGSLNAINTIVKKTKKESPDILICAGDITIFENGLDYFTHRLSRLGKTILFIHGNHETAENFNYVCSLFKNTNFIHKKIFRAGNCVFIGYGGGGFSNEDKEFEKTTKKLLKKTKKDDMIILLTHAPPYKTKLDKINGDYAGNKSIRKFIEKNNIVLSISGHLHENSGKQDKIGKTKLVNPGPFGKIIII